jgi:hypothetical protein
MPEQRLGTRTPPRNGPVRIGDDDGVIRHASYPVPLQNQTAQHHPDLPHGDRLGERVRPGLDRPWILAVVDASPGGGSDDPSAALDLYRGTDGGPGPVLFTLDVEGERFAVRQAGDGGTDYDWLGGPNTGYGFSSSARPNRTVEEHREHIRVFLAMVDPNSGYIEDD